MSDQPDPRAENRPEESLSQTDAAAHGESLGEGQELPGSGQSGPGEQPPGPGPLAEPSAEAAGGLPVEQPATSPQPAGELAPAAELVPAGELAGAGELGPAGELVPAGSPGIEECATDQPSAEGAAAGAAAEQPAPEYSAPEHSAAEQLAAAHSAAEQSGAEQPGAEQPAAEQPAVALPLAGQSEREPPRAEAVVEAALEPVAEELPEPAAEEPAAPAAPTAEEAEEIPSPVAEKPAEPEAVEPSARGVAAPTQPEEPPEEPKSAKMDWYILKVQSNREESIKEGLLRRVSMAGLDRYFGEVIIPTETVTEFKGGKKRVVKRKLYPGYLVVQMEVNDDTWFLVRETPGIGDFTGAAGQPTPMQPHEVEAILQKSEEKAEKQPKLKIAFKPGDQVKINEGTFENFEGSVESIDETNGRVTVIINIFGRSTPVELEYWQVGAI